MAARGRPYPRRGLEDALRVARALKDHNGGNPWPPDQVAEAVGLGPNGTAFFYLTSASRDYGLTEGTRDAKIISLTTAGEELVYAGSPELERQAEIEAFLNVDVFANVLKHFGGSQLPEKRFLSNTLESEFDLKPEWHDEFADVFRENCRYLGITAEWVPGDGVGSADTSPTRTLVAREGAPTCFVIMPFTERDERHPPGFFEEVLESLLKPALSEAGFEVRSAKRTGSDVIQATIVTELLSADLVLADLTEHNPNVLFELGIRMAEEKPVVLIKARGTGRIFDVDNLLRVEEYDPNLWRTSVEKDLPRIQAHVEGAWEGRSTDPTFLSILRRGGQSN